MAAADLTRLLPRTRPRCSAPFAAPSSALRRPVALRSCHRPRTCSHSWPSMMSTQLAPSRRRCGAPTLLATPLSRPLLPLGDHVTATPHAPSLLYYYTPLLPSSPPPHLLRQEAFHPPSPLSFPHQAEPSSPWARMASPPRHCRPPLELTVEPPPRPKLTLLVNFEANNLEITVCGI